MTQTVLILGGTGRFGRHTTQAFTKAGWCVRQFDRHRDNLHVAASSADVIVSAWNPPYPEWEKMTMALHRDVIDVAEKTGATVILPGNVYVYGPNSGSLLAEGTQHHADNPLGRIRIEMERAYRDSNVRTIILRAGDFIDTQASGNWFDKVMIKSLSKGKLTYPGAIDAPHAWAYLPDVARAAVSLAECRHELQRFEDVPYAGFTLTGNELAHVLAQVLGRDVVAQRMNWLPLQLLTPFWDMARCLVEMRYLWTMPHQLDGSKFAQLVPDFKSTPVATALQNATQEYQSTNSPDYILRSTQTSR